MTSTQRILNLGDDPVEAQAIISALEEEGAACDVFQVHSTEEFVKAIEQGGFDIIFTDYSLPGFDGLTARAIQKDKFSKYTVYVHFTDKKRKAQPQAAQETAQQS
ncbi:MAG TPA: response regulator [Dissulfurispiraceae bacterium]|nr:response regulator [Dissulfurispiraceae bacterium]